MCLINNISARRRAHYLLRYVLVTAVQGQRHNNKLRINLVEKVSGVIQLSFNVARILRSRQPNHLSAYVFVPIPHGRTGGRCHFNKKRIIGGYLHDAALIFPSVGINDPQLEKLGMLTFILVDRSNHTFL